MGFWIFMFACDILLPVVMIALGKLFLKHPPKEINGVYGYRTARSMKSQEAWHFAHNYCGRLWVKAGWTLLPVTLVPMVMVIGMDDNMIGIVGLVVCLIQLGVMIWTIFPTERKLKRNFDEDGNRKK